MSPPNLTDRRSPSLPANSSAAILANASPLTRVKVPGNRRRSGLSLIALVIALFVALPILSVLWRAFGFSDPQSNTTLLHLAQTVLPRFALNSGLLLLGVLTVVLLLGVGSAWLVAAFNFPFRRAMAGLLVLPLAMPAFVMAFAYTDFFEAAGPLQTGLRQLMGWQVGQYWFFDIRSIEGASLMLGLSLYPYVYMLARPAFAERSAGLADAARTMGYTGLRLWWRVTLPVARPAIVAGCALVMMETLADFGTVSYFAVDTLAAGVYRAWQGLGDQVAAARLAVMLMMLVAGLAWIEKKSRGRMAAYGRAHRPATRQSLSAGAAWACTALCSLPILFGFGLPMLLLLRAAFNQHEAFDPRLWQWMINTFSLGVAGTCLILPMALAVAYAKRLSESPWVKISAWVAAAGYAVPGLVLAVGILVLSRASDYLGMNWVRASIALVLMAYCARFFAVGFQGVSSGLSRIGPSLDESARSLGLQPLQVLKRVHWPLLRPSLAAAALLVFVDCLKELPATLVLRPFNMDTLAVMAYQYASDERLSAAAAPALAIVLIGLIPTIWLARDQLQLGSVVVNARRSQLASAT